MPISITPLVNGQIYHIYNRGSEKRWIFEEQRDYKRFIKTLIYYQLSGPKPKLSHYFQYQSFKPESATKIVEVLAYCLMPNHFHLILKQLTDGSITEMMSKLSLSYTKYFNTKYRRVGPLFQGEFKSVLVESDEQFIHLSRYIHLNPLVSYLVNDLKKYKWSSYLEYLNLTQSNICQKNQIQDFFTSHIEYEQFVLDQSGYALELEIIKHQLLEVV